MPRKPKKAPLGPLGQALRAAGVETAITEAHERAQAELRARKLKLDERELMQMVFATLGSTDTLDWARLEVVEAVEVVEVVEGGAERAGAGEADGEVGREGQAERSGDGLEVRREPAPPDPLEPLRDRTWAGEAWTDVFPPGLLPRLPAGHAELVERAARAVRVPRLSLRRLNRGPALAQLRAFVTWARASQVRIVRVVTGKGVGSKGDPVIRPAVLEWVATEGAEAVVRWAPEPDRGRHPGVLDPEGDFGVLLLELRSPRR